LGKQIRNRLGKFTSTVTQPVLFSEVILSSLNELLFLLWIVTLTSYATLQAVVEPPAEKKTDFTNLHTGVL
jgi:hypothetical protein